MKENIKLGIRGHIKATSNKDGLVFNDHNEISSGALETILKCMSQLNGEAKVDTIKALGTFGNKERDITFVQYNSNDNTMLFRTIFYEFDFDGTITSLELNSESLGTQLANRTSLSIFKDDSARLQIDWKIQITIN